MPLCKQLLSRTGSVVIILTWLIASDVFANQAMRLAADIELLMEQGSIAFFSCRNGLEWVGGIWWK